MPRSRLDPVFLLAIAANAVLGAGEAPPPGEYPIHAWPLAESHRTADGGHLLWASPFYHHRTGPDGRIRSQHIGPWLRGDDHWALLPLAWRGGADGMKHTGIVPLYFGGPGYDVIPPLLTVSWENAAGSSTWVTPLFHLDRARDGGGASWHVGPWFHAPGGDLVLPLGWHFRRDDGVRQWGVLPFWAQGPDYWAAPGALSWGTWEEDGDWSAHLTPLIGLKRWGRHLQVRLTVLPLWDQHPSGFGSPLLLSGYERGGDGAAFARLTPLLRFGVDGDGRVAGNLGPLYRYGEHWGLVPALMADGDSWCAPAALSGSWPNGVGGRTTWVTPLAHVSTDAAGSTWWHLGPYSHGPKHDILVPLFYSAGEDGARHHGIPGVYHAGPGYCISPALLSCTGRNDLGGRTTWLTPLYHHTTDGDDRSWWHVGPWSHGPDFDVVFPLFYRLERAGARYHGIPGVYHAGPESLCLPSLLSGTWGNHEGGRTTWATPAFHLTTRKDGAASWHVLNYFHGPEHDVLFPLFYSLGKPGERCHGVPGVYHRDQSSLCLPSLLSGSWRDAAGGRTTWATPLAHLSADAAGEIDSLHLLTYYRDREVETLLPLYWRRRRDDATVVPLLYLGLPEADGFSHNLLWPLAEVRTGERLDDGWGTRLKPFVVQSAGEDYECNLLWRTFHLRREGDATTTGMTVGNLLPLWRVEAKEDEPTDWRILGGLVGQYCDRERRRSRWHLLWVIPISGDRAY